MQAPTSPSGPPVHEPDERPCPGCGAANGTAAAFCWQCYRPIGAAGAPSGTAWTLGPTTSPFVGETRSRGLKTMAAVVVVVATLAIIGGAWFLFFRDGAVALPNTLGGLTRIDDPQTQMVVDTFRAQVRTSGIDGDMAIYGNGTPTAALIWIRDAAVPTTDAAFDEFASGFNTGIGASGSLGQKQTGSVGGITFVCAPVQGATPGTICMWQEDDLFWLVFDFSGSSFADGRDLAVAARGSVQAA